MDHTRTEQSEQDKTQRNDNTPAWNRAASIKPMQTKARDQTWAKQNRANKSMPAQVYQDYLTSTVRTPTDQHRQKPPDRRDQDRTVRPNLIKTDTRQTKPNGVPTPNILRKATAFDAAIMMLDQSSASTSNRTDKLQLNRAVEEQTN